MNLYSGMPCWIVKNKLFDYFNPLQEDFSTDVAVIGSGITGSLVAHELCEKGVECCVIDKSSVCMGSSLASTALLQYEIDVPLCDMISDIGESAAVSAYRACLQSITDLEHVFADAGIAPDFERVSSVYYASDKKGLALITREYETRTKHNLPVAFLGRAELLASHGIRAPGALVNAEAAQVDTYSAATGLLRHHMKKDRLPVFSHTEIVDWEEGARGYVLTTGNGHKVRCKYVVIAAGFEAGTFLPRQVMKLTSTYAIMSQPLSPEQFWPGRSLIWETKEPYLYVRTAGGNRIILGGEDEDFSSPERRDRLLRKKVQTLQKRMLKLFPDIPCIPEAAWCGTFSSTKDGLPYIGPWPGKKRMLFALGYGGNGITFSMIAAQIIAGTVRGRKDPRADLFGFSRKPAR